MIVTLIANITEVQMTAAEAVEQGYMTSEWQVKWAAENPRGEFYVYRYGPARIEGGFIFGERADFGTLVEFSECAADALECIGHSIWNEMNGHSIWPEMEGKRAADAPLFA